MRILNLSLYMLNDPPPHYAATPGTTTRATARAQRNTNVRLNRGVLEGLGLADSALGCKATATGKKRARLGAPGQKSASESLGEEPPRPRSTRLAGRDRRRYSQDLLGSEEEEEE